jgi:hypothetical protein
MNGRLAQNIQGNRMRLQEINILRVFHLHLHLMFKTTAHRLPMDNTFFNTLSVQERRKLSALESIILVRMPS